MYVYNNTVVLLHLFCVLIVLLQVTVYDIYVVVLLKTMYRRLMEIMLMAKLMEIVSSIVVYVYLYIHIYYIYLSIYTLPAINS